MEEVPNKKHAVSALMTSSEIKKLKYYLSVDMNIMISALLNGLVMKNVVQCATKML